MFKLSFRFIKKKLILQLFLLIIIFSLFSNVFGDCATPEKIAVYSGDEYLGNFNPNDLIYVHDDLSIYPLKIIFEFENPTQCFSSKNNMSLQLFPNAVFKTADSYISKNISNNYYENFTFIFNQNILLNSNIVSTYKIFYGDKDYSGILNFDNDDTPPIFNVLSYQPTDVILKPDTNVSVTISISDLESGLDKIFITGLSSGQKIITFENNKTYENGFTTTVSEDTNIKIIAYDKLGNFDSKNISFVVDTEKPKIISKTITQTFVNNKRYATLKINVSDLSLNYYDDLKVFANLNSINDNSNYKKVYAQCSKISKNISQCVWNNIPITLDNSKDINVPVNITNHLGISSLENINFNVKVDKESPQILDFYLINGLDVKNIFSSNDTNSTIILKFKDDSISNNHYTLNINFGRMQFIPPNEGCIYLTPQIVQCNYTLKDNVRAYNNVKELITKFGVTISDDYSNTISKNITEIIDNVKPNITKFSYTTNKDFNKNLLENGDLVTFTIFVNDSNLVPQYDKSEIFVYGLFDNLNTDVSYQNYTKGNCVLLSGDNLAKCQFSNIKINTYLHKPKIYFKIYDAANNEFVRSYNLTIYNVSNQSPNIFVQNETFAILNPINRNRLKSVDGASQEPVTAWFKGKLNLISSFKNKGFEILNYQLVPDSCNFSQLDPLSVESNILWPDNAVIGSNNFDNDSKFFVKTTILSNLGTIYINNLNDKTMHCQLSVVFRDNKTVFQPLKVGINLKYQFYSIPEGDLVRANAEKILSMAKSADDLGSWFYSTYKIYKLFDRICYLISGAGGLIANVNRVWVPIGMVFEKNPSTMVMAKKISCSLQKSDGILSFLNFGNKYIDMICDFITCKNGGLLGDMMHGGIFGKAGSSVFKTFMNAQKIISNAVCVNPIVNVKNNEVKKNDKSK